MTDAGRNQILILTPPRLLLRRGSYQKYQKVEVKKKCHFSAQCAEKSPSFLIDSAFFKAFISVQPFSLSKNLQDIYPNLQAAESNM